MVYLLTHRLFRGGMAATVLAGIIWLFCVLWLPDSSVPWRQIAISMCYFFWLVLQVIPHLYHLWFNQKFLGKLQSRSSLSGDSPITDEHLSHRFNEAIALLKKIPFDRKGARQPGPQYLYLLPWYVIIGAPGAGKTTALINSGLHFPLAESLGKNAVRGVGGTRDCDWWFTNQAVLLDTAGRYTMQESMPARDAAEWSSFIHLLKRYRPYQPVNGVILTISVADLLSSSEDSRHVQAHRLRLRISELHQKTGIKFPVYIMITKMDLLKGFMDFFAALDKSQREQYWGFTFPWHIQPPSSDSVTENFRLQFERLVLQLKQKLPAEMCRENHLPHRASCFLFPQEVAALEPLLMEYITTIFPSDEGEIAWPGRGIFFTSGTQEGLPFDRIMGELTRKLQLSREEHQNGLWDSVNREAPIPASKGQSFFIHQLLNEVIFKEHDLAGSNHTQQRRYQRLYWYMTGGLILIPLIIIIFWLASYLLNQHYLQKVTTGVMAINTPDLQTTQTPAEEILQLLPRLNSLSDLVKVDDVPLNHPYFYMQQASGFHQAEQISLIINNRYQQTLKSSLLPRIMILVTSLVDKNLKVNDEFERQTYQAYQMLHEQSQYDADFLRSWVLGFFKQQRATPEQLIQLDHHLRQLFSHQPRSLPYKPVQRNYSLRLNVDEVSDKSASSVYLGAVSDKSIK